MNRVNLRREFFFVSPAEVRQFLSQLDEERLLEAADHPDGFPHRCGWTTSRRQDSSRWSTSSRT